MNVLQMTVEMGPATTAPEVMCVVAIKVTSLSPMQHLFAKVCTI